jgi:hypothetical protein
MIGPDICAFGNMLIACIGSFGLGMGAMYYLMH